MSRHIFYTLPISSHLEQLGRTVLLVHCFLILVFLTSRRYTLVVLAADLEPQRRQLSSIDQDALADSIASFLSSILGVPVRVASVTEAGPPSPPAPPSPPPRPRLPPLAPASTGLSVGAQVGIGVSVGVGGFLLLLLLLYLLMLRRGRIKREQETSAAEASTFASFGVATADDALDPDAPWRGPSVEGEGEPEGEPEASLSVLSNADRRRNRRLNTTSIPPPLPPDGLEDPSADGSNGGVPGVLVPAGSRPSRPATTTVEQRLLASHQFLSRKGSSGQMSASERVGSTPLLLGNEASAGGSFSFGSSADSSRDPSMPPSRTDSSSNVAILAAGVPVPEYVGWRSCPSAARRI